MRAWNEKFVYPRLNDKLDFSLYILKISHFIRSNDSMDSRGKAERVEIANKIVDSYSLRIESVEIFCHGRRNLYEYWRNILPSKTDIRVHRLS